MLSLGFLCVLRNIIIHSFPLSVSLTHQSACIASVVRMVYIVQLYRGSDPSWDTFDVSIWSGVELAVAIITASLPAIRPLLTTLFPRLLPSTRGVSRPANYGMQNKSASHLERNISLSVLKGRRRSNMVDDESTKALCESST